MTDRDFTVLHEVVSLPTGLEPISGENISSNETSLNEQL
jgi:hypothetical protein